MVQNAGFEPTLMVWRTTGLDHYPNSACGGHTGNQTRITRSTVLHTIIVLYDHWVVGVGIFTLSQRTTHALSGMG